MINDELLKFLEVDAEFKDEAWATERVRLIMSYAKPLQERKEYDEAENVLFGKFPEINMKKLLVGNMLPTLRERLSDNSVFLFERARNAMIDERTSAGLSVIVNSLDPEKEEKKKSDKELLINRKGIEHVLNSFTESTGMRQKKVGTDKYHGNIDDFDSKGYNEMDGGQVKIFFEHNWGLKQEINLQNVINPVFRNNQITRNFDKWINSIFMNLHAACRVYVSELNGAIKIEPLKAYQVRVLNATGSNDYKDSQAFDLPYETNVMGFLRDFGTDIDFDNDWKLIINAAHNGTTDHGFTGISHDNMLLYGSDQKVINFKSLLSLPINYGYAEWKTINRKRKQYVVTPEGNIVPSTIDSHNPPVHGAQTKTKSVEDTYRAYYFNVGLNTPKLIKWGKLYMQEIEGINDEYSGFSIKVSKRDGVPMVEVLKPLWHIMNVCFKMFEMLVNDIKPDGFYYNYDSMVKIAMYLQAAKDVPTDVLTAIEDFMRMSQDSPNTITMTVTQDSGDPIGGNGDAVKPRKNGLNSAAADLVKIMDWVEAKVEKWTASQGIENTDTGDGYKVSLENKQRTRASTSFIDFILLNLLEDISVSVVNVAQDISKFKDLAAYKYLECQAGYKTMEFISTMKKSPHRYGTFMDTFNRDIDLMEIREQARQDMLNLRISLEQYIVVKSTDNARKAVAYLAEERYKADKKRQEDAAIAHGQAMELKQAERQALIELENLKGKWMRLARGEEAKGFIQAANINSQASITREQMKNEGQNQRLANAAENDLNKIAETSTKLSQQPAPVS